MAFPPTAMAAHLDTVEPVSERHRAAFAADGHVVIRGAVGRSVIEAARRPLIEAFHRHRPDVAPVEDRPTAYERAFVQLVNLGDREPEVAALTHSRRIAAMAADLLGVEGIRIFVEDAFFKEAGCGGTPWHQDASAIPIEPEAVVTAWVPLRTVVPAHGGLRFASASHRLGLVGPVDISEATDEAFSGILAEHDLEIHEVGRLEPGDISFHAGTTIHSARPNPSSEDREVFAIHYFAAGALVIPPDNPSRANLLRHLAPELSPGDPAIADAWPLVFGVQP